MSILAGLRPLDRATSQLFFLSSSSLRKEFPRLLPLRLLTSRLPLVWFCPCLPATKCRGDGRFKRRAWRECLVFLWFSRGRRAFYLSITQPSGPLRRPCKHLMPTLSWIGYSRREYTYFVLSACAMNERDALCALVLK